MNNRKPSERFRDFLPGLFIGILLTAGSASSFGLPGKAAKSKPNLLLITIDTLRPDRLSCYGSPYLKTPNIDRLVKEGVLFSKAFAQTTTTLPSHTNILLGTTPLQHGVHDNANFTIRPDSLTLAEHLKKFGYSTAAFVGGFPLDSRFGLDQGFDVYNDEFEGRRLKKQLYRERKGEIVVEKALGWVDRQDSPWFLWVHCFDPHSPYEPPEPFLTQYQDRLYDGEVAYVDFVLKKLLDDLRKKGSLENTVIIFTGDHGESLGEHGEETHGYYAYNSTLWIPLIISGPGLKPGAVDQQVAHIDIFPTVCDLLKIDPPSNLQGLSLLRAIKGKALPKRAVYFESLYPHYSLGWAPLYGYLQDSDKFIESPIPELYDEAKDFNELKNLLPGKDINIFRQRLSQLTLQQAGLNKAGRQNPLDRQSQEKLKSLGYLSSGQGSKKEKYDAGDDIKTLLPYQNRASEALGLYESGRRREGIEQLRRILTERENLDFIYSMLARLYKREGRMEEALLLLKKGTEVFPSNFKILSNYIVFLNEVGRFDEVIRLVTAGGDYPLKKIAESWNDLGFAYMNKGDFSKALEAYKEALALDDHYAIVYQNLGRLSLSVFLKTKDANDYRKAIEHYQKSLEIDPGDVWAYDGLGAVYLQGNEPRESISCFQRVIEAFPDYAPSLSNLGIAYFKAGDKEKALEIFVLFKDRFSARVPPAQMKAVDSLIEQCKLKEPDFSISAF